MEMMWSTSVASLKENLYKIAQDVHHDDDDEDEESSIYNNSNDSPNRRFSDRSFSYSNSPPPQNSQVSLSTFTVLFMCLPFYLFVWIQCYVH